MTLTQLRYLLAIVDANLNISLAATRVNATQPGLSRQIKGLEEELGFQIFVRHGKSLSQLTASGAEMVERARVILGEVRNIDIIAANHRRDSRGVLRVAMTQTLGRFVLPPALHRLRARFAGVQVRLRPGGEQECLAMLERDEIDLALVSTEGEWPAGDVAIPLFHWRRAVIATAAHPLAAASSPVTLAALAQHPLIGAESAAHALYKIGRVFHAHGLVPTISCTARDADTIKTFVRLDLGIGIVAEMALTPEDADLVDLRAGDLFPTCTTWAVLRADRIQRDYLFELLRELTPFLPIQDIQQIMAGARDVDLTGKVRSWRSLSAAHP
jgi:DNA-binding transcriptional LysR family regulator